jgi:chemotaxis regulatin CheY-phosphate phosphatase CheZ
MAPFVKTGGLGDVVGSLSGAVRALGHEVSVFLPRYRSIDIQALELETAIDYFELIVGNQLEATRVFLNGLPERTSQASSLFTDIMLAQDFHDLTGQVINKIVGIAQNVEDQLVHLLLDTTPPEARAQVESEWLNGPVIDVKRDDVVNSQGQVDDLLASLGF